MIVTLQGGPRDGSVVDVPGPRLEVYLPPMPVPLHYDSTAIHHTLPTQIGWYEPDPESPDGSWRWVPPA